MADEITLPEDYNIIQLATGDSQYKGRLVLGEPFYDVVDQNIYIGGLPNATKYRIGGHNGLHFKGILTCKNYTTLESSTKDIRQPGDCWLLRKDISSTSFVAGQLIIWTGDVRISEYRKSNSNYNKSWNIVNAYKGWIPVAGGTGSGESEFSNETIPTAKNPREGQGADFDYSSAVTNVQDALTTIFNTRCNYIGTCSVTDIEKATQIGSAFDFLRSGEWTVYIGDTIILEVNGQEITLHSGDQIWCQNEEYNIIPAKNYVIATDKLPDNSEIEDKIYIVEKDIALN